MKFVLVHGAWTGAWIWERLKPLLVSEGHHVIAPSLRGVGEGAELGGPQIGLVAHVNDLVDAMDGHVDLVLVGFSYGGMVIGGAAELAPDRVAKIIYLDAFVPASGRSMLDAMSPPARAALEASSVGGWLPPMPLEPLGKIEEGAGTDDEIRRRLARRAAMPLRAFTDPAGPIDRSIPIPKTYVHCRDKAPGDLFARIAETAWSGGCAREEIDAGHFACQTAPRTLAAILTRLAR